MTATRWGDYEVFFDRILGKGGMGSVYLGRQVSVNRPVAIKLLNKGLGANSAMVEQFERESAVLGQFVDPNIVQIFGAGYAEGRRYIAMEYVEGKDLATALRTGRRFSVREALHITIGAARALKTAWDHSIVHRDVKPSNIIISHTGTVKLTDFGLAKNIELDITAMQTSMGTAKYVAPEQVLKQPYDVRGDMYSLGVVLYELTAGKPPFEGVDLKEVIGKHVKERPVPPSRFNSAIKPDVEAVILKLLEKNPEDRYESPDLLVEDLKRLLMATNVGSRRMKIREDETGTDVVMPAGSSSQVLSALFWFAVVAAGGALLYFGGAPLLEPPRIDASISAPPHVGATEEKPEGKPEAKVPSVDLWEVQRRRGLEAFRSKRWSTAIALLEEARKLGAGDLEETIRRARYEDLLAKGDAAMDPGKALGYFQEAQKQLDDEKVQGRIAGASYRLCAAKAAALEAKDWASAAEHWGRAREHARGEREIGESESRREFCRTFAGAEEAMAAGDANGALERYRKLSAAPGDHKSLIDAGIRAAEARLTGARREEIAGLRKELAPLLERGRQAYRRADWKGAKALFDRAADRRFEGAVSPDQKEEILQRRRELAAAVAPPEGMTYVVAGAFTMGGGRPVESPAWEARTKAFYIDVREVSVREYRAFLDALGSSGHHPGCHADEPEGTNHDPGSWMPSDPDAPVVGVSWWDAVSYAAWCGKRLPFEVEWEKAAGFRPDGKNVYPWGDTYRKEGGPSFFGCTGMGSGVLEWTAGWFDKYPGSGASDPDFGRRKKVLRGGALLQEDAPAMTKVTYRHRSLPSYRSPRVGFRCVKEITTTEER